MEEGLDVCVLARGCSGLCGRLSKRGREGAVLEHTRSGWRACICSMCACLLAAAAARLRRHRPVCLRCSVRLRAVTSGFVQGEDGCGVEAAVGVRFAETVRKQVLCGGRSNYRF